MQHLLAVALEAEVARLDDPRMHRSHRHLVDLVALHAEEVRDTGAIALLEAHRLEPRMAPRGDAQLLGDLALEEVRLRALRGQRRIFAADLAASTIRCPAASSPTTA